MCGNEKGATVLEYSLILSLLLLVSLGLFGPIATSMSKSFSSAGGGFGHPGNDGEIITVE